MTDVTKVKIVLIYPPIVFGQKRGFGWPPLGILYIATFLQKKGIDVKVLDSFIVGHTLEELREVILKENPDVVGFSAMTCQVNVILDIAEELKKYRPFVKIVVGGPHISSTKEELFKFSGNIDFLFYGEAEKTFYKFINALGGNESFEEIEGIIYKQNGRTIINNPPQPTQDLDTLPFPNLGLLDIYKYDSYYAKSLPLTSLLASRGCPYHCTFCDAYATHGRIVRFRSSKNVVDEMEHNYKKYAIKQFTIKDSTFTVNKNWVYEICSDIEKRGLKINWTCNTRVDLVDEALLMAMKKSGCYMILFGIESGSQKVLDMMKKGITIEQIKKAISLCKKTGIERVGYFIIGNPGETEEDVLKTINLIKELDFDLVDVGRMVAYPGTEIYQWGLENKALPDRFWYMKKDIKISKSIREVNGNLNLKNFSL